MSRELRDQGERSVRRKDTNVKRATPVSVFRSLVWAGVTLVFAMAGAAQTGGTVVVPVVNGSVGSCSALFTVLDSAKKPLYDAKINVTVRYGFGGLHRTELQVGTNSEGKARVIGLPERSKKPLEFRVRSGELSKTVLVDPAAKCESSVEVVLGEK